ncbi:MAG: flagellar basal-body rod protein FlgF [Alphaproteobacteria bacterium]|nr:flagellar basal-body rod protein FlgF [Alphaproteobacteria bacterium]
MHSRHRAFGKSGTSGKIMQAASLVLTSYQDSLSRALDVVANNVANATTSGFKREDIQFETLISRTTPTQQINFGVDKGTIRNTSPGPLLTTGNPLDVAIQGKGYFQIQTQNGTRYTRNGTFVLNEQGQVVTPSGDKLLGDGDQPITLPEDARDFQIGADGIVSVMSGTGKDVTQVGKIKTVVFDNEQELQSLGNGLYATAQTPKQDKDGTVVQGMVEQSNVQSVNEITNMIEILRSYQQVARMLENEHQRLSTAISRLSKTTA